jgi:nucleotide-binding universal stress UspA family protein
MKQILLAVDPDGLAEAVVPAVVALASAPNARVLVIHVVDPTAPDLTWLNAASVISDVVVRLAREGIQAEGQARDGTRRTIAARIVAAADEIDADLIALGSHGRGDITGMLLGSVGHRVAALTDRPLLVARPTPAAEGAQALKRIMVAVDRSPQSPPAVELAAVIASERGAQVRLVHALSNVLVEGGAYMEPLADAIGVMGPFGALLRARGIQVSTQTLDGFGPVAGRIAAAATAWNADLLVIGSRRLGELSALLQGSTSHGVIAESDRPVLLAGSSAR